MVIQHNLQSSFTSMQIGQTERSRAKTQEKLASGYRINRACDDAAGLEISEKMRRQIRGLKRAAVNGEDGISFVQIADGALEEVHDMLQRGNELAVQAANGTNSASDREAINNEIIELKKEIDRVAETSKFNEIQIFSKRGVLPTPYNGEPGEVLKSDLQKLADKIKDEYQPNAVRQILDKIPLFEQVVKEAVAKDPTIFNTTLTLDYIDGIGGTLAFMAAGYLYNPTRFDPRSLDLNVDKDDYPSIYMSEYNLGRIESTIAHETMHAVMEVVYPSRWVGDSAQKFPKWFYEGTAQLAGGDKGWTSNIKRRVSMLKSEDDSSGDEAISAYMGAGGEFTVDDRPYGHGYLACAYACYLAASGDEVSQENMLDGARKIFQTIYDNPEDIFDDVMQSAMGISVSDLKDAINTGSKSEIKSGKMSAVEFVRRYMYQSNGGWGSIIADSFATGGTDILKETAKREDQPIRITNMNTAYQAIATDDESKGRYASISLHLGTDADMPNKIMVLQYDMSSDALGLTDTNVLSADNATNAINDFGKAIMMVSGVRSYFGAIQNRLEHTIKNLDNIVENTTSAESRLRDTDMAEEMVRLSTYNIIQQAGNAMLTQANQTPQGDLKLLQ